MKLSVSYTKFKRPLAYFTAIIISLGAVESTFFVLERNQIEATEKLVHSILRQEINASNSFLLSRALTDLENVGLIQCTQVYSQKTKVNLIDLTYLPHCHERSSLKISNRVKINLQSLNGEVWEIAFNPSENQFFRISIWLARILAVSTSVLLLWFVLTRFDRTTLLRRQKEDENIALLRKMHEQQQELIEIENKAQSHAYLADHAAQMVHDIKSPLSVISLLSSKPGLPSEEETRILQKAAEAVIETAETLLKKSRNTPSLFKANPGTLDQPPSMDLEDIPTQTFSTLENVCKHVERMKQVEIARTGKSIRLSLFSDFGNPESQLLFDPIKTQLIVSNLVNNSMESIERDGFITLTLAEDEGRALIEVRDSGKGIPPQILEQIGKRRITYDKKDGNGIGLYSAIQSLKSWKGSLRIQSSPMNGTKVQLELRPPL